MVQDGCDLIRISIHINGCDLIRISIHIDGCDLIRILNIRSDQQRSVETSKTELALHLPVVLGILENAE